MNGLFVLRFGTKGQEQFRRSMYYLVLFGLFLFSAFRYEVGCDWSGYYYQYLGAGYRGFDGAFADREPIWWAILAAQHYLGLPYPWANVASSLVFFGGVHVLARRQPDPLAFLILLFPILIVNMPMSGIRQGAAIGLICVALAAFVDRKPIAFGVWIVLAAGFHASALVFLLLTPLASGRLTQARIALSLLLAVPGAIVIAGGDTAQLAVDRYVTGDIDAAGSAFRVGILTLTGLYYFLFLRGPWRRSSPEDGALATIGAIGMLLMIALVPVSTVIGDRLGYYLIPIQAMIFARIPYLQIQRSKVVHTVLPYLGLILVFTVWTSLSGHFQKCYLPYDSWLFGFPGGLPFRFG